VYSSIFTTLYQDGLIPPLFSLAISRDISGPSGYLALGGLPDVDFTPDFTSTPILITTIAGYPKAFDFYTINIDSIVLNGSLLSGSGGDIEYIVDSGTTLNYFPTQFANMVNSQFSPPAEFNADFGAYVVDCNATTPELGIKINGTTFEINSLDLILLAGQDENGNDICISGIDDGGADLTEDVFILGDTFQKNVVTVFDVGAAELRFAARVNYTSNDPVKA
jgi:aspergillopepsin I